MTDNQIGVWFLFLILGLGVCVINPSPNYFAALSLVLLTYPIFCRVVNTVAKLINNKIMKTKANDIRTITGKSS